MNEEVTEYASYIRREARRQLYAEMMRDRVEEEKRRLRAHRPLWQRVCPFEITIRRRTNVSQ